MVDNGRWALEDKIVKSACVMVLNAIYEEDFLERWRRQEARGDMIGCEEATGVVLMLDACEQMRITTIGPAIAVSVPAILAAFLPYWPDMPTTN
jgi:hypothetical protein